MCIHTSRRSLLPAGILSLAPAALWAQASAPPRVPTAVRQESAIIGRVVSAEDDAAIGAASVRLLELGRGELSHQDGSFHFDGLPAGSYTIAVQRLGFAPTQQAV